MLTFSFNQIGVIKTKPLSILHKSENKMVIFSGHVLFGLWNTSCLEHKLFTKS